MFRSKPTARTYSEKNSTTHDGTASSAVSDQPRERLLRLGIEPLADTELLALIFRTGRREESALKLSERLLASCGGLDAVAMSSLVELQRIPGIGPAKAASLLGSVEIGRRLATRSLARGDRISGPQDVYRHFNQRMRSRRQEHFVVILLDGRNRVMGESQISQGTLTASLVHPREVFRSAIRSAAAALVLVHNHPSGDPEPSAEDLSVTHRLVEAGEIVGIRIVDHVVVADRGFYSFQEHGQLSR